MAKEKYLEIISDDGKEKGIIYKNESWCLVPNDMLLILGADNTEVLNMNKKNYIRPKDFAKYQFEFTTKDERDNFGFPETLEETEFMLEEFFIKAKELNNGERITISRS